MRAIVILNDTLRRDHLECYGARSVYTPNYNAFAEEATVFEKHYCGSMPCMPARRDLFTGRLNFLERSWGPIEITDTTFPSLLRNAGIRTHMITDHAHYFRIGGENYCQQFDTYEFFRGQESDPWISLVDDPYTPKDYFGVMKRQYQCNRTHFKEEKDFPSVRCFDAAKEWVRENKDTDNWLLMVETFDPHEPFDMPREYLELYKDTYDGPAFELPIYHKIDTETKEAVEHLRNRYKALITMTDRHFGEFMETLKECNMYEDTLILCTTDHGYCLGERGYLGKTYMPCYEELTHIPLLVHRPGQKEQERRTALSQNIDLMPTLLAYYGLEIPGVVQGRSLLPVLKSDTHLQDYALFGTFGLSVNITDGRYVYMRAPRTDDLYEYTTSLTTIRNWLGKGQEDEISMGRFLPWTKYPVYKVPSVFNPLCSDLSDQMDLLFDLNNDPEELHPLQDDRILNQMKGMLVKALKDVQAPEEQFIRLGLDGKETDRS